MAEYFLDQKNSFHITPVEMTPARESAIEAARMRYELYGVPPTAVDWNPSMAQKRAGQAWRAKRYYDTPKEARKWISSIQTMFGSWNNFLAHAGFEPVPMSGRRSVYTEIPDYQMEQVLILNKYGFGMKFIRDYLGIPTSDGNLRLRARKWAEKHDRRLHRNQGTHLRMTPEQEKNLADKALGYV